MNIKVTFSNNTNDLSYLYNILIDIILSEQDTSEQAYQKGEKKNECNVIKSEYK